MFHCRLNPFKNQHIKVLFSYHVTVFFFSARLSNIESHLYLTVNAAHTFWISQGCGGNGVDLRVRAGGADDDDEEDDDEDDDDREDNGDAFGDKFAMYPQ